MVTKIKLDNSCKTLGMGLDVISIQEAATTSMIVNHSFQKTVLMAVKTDNTFSLKSLFGL